MCKCLHSTDVNVHNSQTKNLYKNVCKQKGNIYPLCVTNGHTNILCNNFNNQTGNNSQYFNDTACNKFVKQNGNNRNFSDILCIDSRNENYVKSQFNKNKNVCLFCK